MLKELLKLANRLDQLGLTKEADVLDSFVRKTAEANIPPVSVDSAAKVDASPIADNKDPAKILGIKTIQDVQFKSTDIQNALNNTSDLILGKNGDETAIKAYKSLMLVLDQAIVTTDIAKQLSDVRKASADLISWMNKGGRTPNSILKKYYDFLAAAAGRLSAGKPVFDFKTSTLNVVKDFGNIVESNELKLQGDKWTSYISRDRRRAPIRDAWSKLSGGKDLSFDNYVLWWKSNKTDKRFNDNNAGGIDATIARLKAEAGQ